MVLVPAGLDIGKLAGIKCLSVPRGIDGERTSECMWVHGVCT